MPAFVINAEELKTLTNPVDNVISESQKTSNIGEVTEWPNVLDSKSSELLRVPRVQIPPSPPENKPGYPACQAKLVTDQKVKVLYAERLSQLLGPEPWAVTCNSIALNCITGFIVLS